MPGKQCSGESVAKMIMSRSFVVMPGVLDRLLGRGHGEVGRADALVGEAPLLDARSLHDPLVRRVDAVLRREGRRW